MDNRKRKLETSNFGGVMKKLPVLLTFMAFAAGLFGRDIQYVEKFSLADDRAQALKELIPGTRDYYYYHALDAQNRGDVQALEGILKAWIARYKLTGRVKEIQNRQALLDYEKNSEKTLQHIRNELNIRFNHSRKVEGRKPSHPTKLNPALISSEAFLQRALRNNTVSGVEPGSVWNTMPCHTHERRTEVYKYFGMDEASRVFHMMGPKEETRHITIANEQAVISPMWSIHSGCGTGAYTFCWSMGGENQRFDDMDHIAIADLK